MKHITIILLILLVIPLIQSAGVATSYWDSNPLKLSPGETTTVSVRLQNSESDSVILKATIDSEVASLVDDPEYTVIKGTSVPVNIKVTIPQNAVIGAKYEVLINFQEMSTGTGGMLRVATGITSKLPIEVVSSGESQLQKEAPITGEAVSGKSNTINYITALVAIAVVLIIIFVIKKSRKPKRLLLKKQNRFKHLESY